jgi:hypothetical protein
MEDTLGQTKAEFLRAKERMAHALSTPPDDKINWAPSPTARTPLQLVAHSAMGITGIQDMLAGKPFPYSGPAELDTASRTAEKEYNDARTGARPAGTDQRRLPGLARHADTGAICCDAPTAFRSSRPDGRRDYFSGAPPHRPRRPNGLYSNDLRRP